MQKVISFTVDLPDISTQMFRSEIRKYIEGVLDARVSDDFDGVDNRPKIDNESVFAGSQNVHVR